MPASPSLLIPPGAGDLVTWPAGFGSRFMLFVDTEEEFDWSAPFDRAATRVTHVAGLALGQRRFSDAGVRPVYLCDQAIVDNAAASELIADWHADGAADIGAHLHPWITPPHDEVVCVANSFAGNLPESLERAKLVALTEAITRAMGARPLVYRAGRYGAGPNTARILLDLGYRLDCSVRSRFDYRSEHGPDYSAHPQQPYRLGPGGRLIVLPLSTALTGRLRLCGERLFRLSSRTPAARGLLARLNLVQRVPLTPEGVSPDEAVAAIDVLLEEQVRVLNFSFHSPTLEPGNTPYVRDAADLQAFWRWWDRVFDHLARRGVEPLGLTGLLALAGSGPSGKAACQSG